MKLQVDGIDKVARVVVVPSLPVPVLLGRDLFRDLPEGLRWGAQFCSGNAQWG